MQVRVRSAREQAGGVTRAGAVDRGVQLNFRVMSPSMRWLTFSGESWQLDMSWHWTWYEFGKLLGGVGVSWHICQDAQGRQTHPIGPSYAKSRQVTCHLPDADTPDWISALSIARAPIAACFISIFPTIVALQTFLAVARSQLASPALIHRRTHPLLPHTTCLDPHIPCSLSPVLCPLDLAN